MMRVKAYKMLAQQKRGGSPVGGPRAVKVKSANPPATASRASMQKSLRKKGAGGIAAIRARITAERRGKPAPAVTVGGVRKRSEAAFAAAFDIAAAKQVAVEAGVNNLMAVKQEIKSDTVAAAAEHMQAVARKAGIDYDAAKKIYDGQVGVDTIDKIAAIAEPMATQAMRAVNKVAETAHDGPLAVVGESPTGRPDDEPMAAPAPMVDPKVLMGVAALGLLLLVKG
jgi:hypothetical protein